MPTHGDGVYRQWKLGRCQLGILKWAKQVSSDLRKTALGASSPAKPALHIPELAFSQFMFSVGVPVVAAAQPKDVGQHCWYDVVGLSGPAGRMDLGERMLTHCQ
jgi:hypothetical protein